jgi:hypothetical protein
VAHSRWGKLKIGINLKGQYSVSEVFEKLVPLASAAPRETFDDVEKRAQLAIVGLGN